MLPEDLRPGPVVVEVDYRNQYDLTGDGFHRFIDPEDGTEYVYSNFQPFEAHRLFPCFDQPDIKATYQLTVDAPVGLGGGERVAGRRRAAAGRAAPAPVRADAALQHVPAAARGRPLACRSTRSATASGARPVRAALDGAARGA